MEKAMMLKAAWIFLIMSIAMLAFTFRYFHYSKENGLLGTEYHKKTIKPFVSMLFGVLGANLLFASIVFFVLAMLQN